MLRPKVKYIDKKMPKLEHIGGNKRSTWIDVRASKIKVNGELRAWEVAEDTEGKLQVVIDYKAGDYVQVYLGFAMELPQNKEAYTAPRGSTFKTYGLLQTNSWGVVDEAYCGNNDEWFIPFYATKDGVIGRHERVGQFRIIDKMEEVEFEEVEVFNHADRGGHGSTGRN